MRTLRPGEESRSSKRSVSLLKNRRRERSPKTVSKESLESRKKSTPKLTCKPLEKIKRSSLIKRVNPFDSILWTISFHF